jgi:hypothetical protein
MSVLELRLQQLEKDCITYNKENFVDAETVVVLAIMYGYYNQILEYYDKNGDLIYREHCNYNDFT